MIQTGYCIVRRRAARNGHFVSIMRSLTGLTLSGQQKITVFLGRMAITTVKHGLRNSYRSTTVL
jgi:hypothetical protein